MSKTDRNREMYDMYMDGATYREIAERYSMSVGNASITVRYYASRNSLPMTGRRSKPTKLATDIISEIAQQPTVPMVAAPKPDANGSMQNGDSRQYTGLLHHSSREVKSMVGTIRAIDHDRLRMMFHSFRMPVGLAMNVYKYHKVGDLVALEYYADTNTLKSIVLISEGG